MYSSNPGLAATAPWAPCTGLETNLESEEVSKSLSQRPLTQHQAQTKTLHYSRVMLILSSIINT